MIELRPIRETSAEYEPIEKEILELFRQEIFLPLIRELGLKKKEVIKNSVGDLIDAIRLGTITFYRGKFQGRFNSVLSKSLRDLGARWNRSDGAYEILASKLPIDIRNAINEAEERFTKAALRVTRKLEKISGDAVADKLNISKLYQRTVGRVNQKFEESIKGITVAPELTQEQKIVIAEEYAENMKLYIRDWTEEQIKELRQKMQTSTLRGVRYESIIAEIKKSYGVSQNKAKFLARQETGLLVAKIREVRYQDAGVTQYRWRTVVGTPAHPVRPEHKALDGKIFSWNNPPVVNEKGDRKNPGEDFNCRCTAIPIVKF